MSIRLKLRQEFVEQHHLSAAHDESFERLFIIVRPNFSAIKEERMVGSFLELHG